MYPSSSDTLHLIRFLWHDTEDDVVKRHEAKKAAAEAKKLPVGFISQDVKKERTPPPAPKEKKPVVKKEVIPVGFIAEDVKRQHHAQ